MGLSVYMCATCMKTSWRLEEDTRSWELELLTDTCHLLGFWELNVGPLQQQQVFLNCSVLSIATTPTLHS